MLIGTFLYSVVHWWLIVLKIAVFHPMLALKVGFLWFCMAFAVSYLFFLMVHKSDVLYVRREIAVKLAYSLWLSFLISSVFMAFYEYILSIFYQSAFFTTQKGLIRHLSFMTHDPYSLYQRLCFLMVLCSGLLAAHYVGALLDQWYEERVSNRYGWSILATTLLCWGFLWSIHYVV